MLTRSGLILFALALTTQSHAGKLTGTRTIVSEPYSYVLKTQFGETGIGPNNFQLPYGTFIDHANGHLYVADCHNSSIQKFTLEGKFLAHWGGEMGSALGQFHYPADLSLDRRGNIYVVEEGNNRVQVLDPSGKSVRTFGSFGTDLGQLSNPLGIAINSHDEVFVTSYRGYQIQVFDLEGHPLRMFGTQGGGPGQLSGPYYIEVDSKDNLFVVDRTSNRIIKFDRFGKFLTEWGGSGDMPGKLNFPHEIAVDHTGKVYVADTGNHRFQVFDPNGKLITTFGDESIFSYPKALNVDLEGNVYVGDRYNAIGQITVWRTLKPGEPPLPLEPVYPPEFPQKLSSLGVFSDLPSLTPADSTNVFYRPKWPLWTNGAVKSRLIQIPPQTVIDNANPDFWHFPNGTRIIKTFSYKIATDLLRHVESRVLVKSDNKWLYAAYRWNDTQQDASLLPNNHSEVVRVTPLGGKPFDHKIPSRSQCISCHASHTNRVIGISELQLNKPLQEGEKTQLEQWHERGMFSSPLPEYPQAIHAEDLTTLKVKGYIFGNCVHCHNAFAPLNLHPDVFDESIKKEGVKFPGKIVAPGVPDKSLLYQLMSRGTMPQLGVQLVDTEGIQTIRNWIESLSLD